MLPFTGSVPLWDPVALLSISSLVKWGRQDLPSEWAALESDIPSSGARLLCDLGQVASPLCAWFSSS